MVEELIPSVRPQWCKLPTESRARLAAALATMWLNRPATAVGVARLVVLASPNWPSLLRPHANTLPSALRAKEK